MNVCICIVTRNRPCILENTLNRFEELELDNKVLIIDGSDDDRTELVCERFGCSYLSQNSVGRVEARNEGLEHTNSEIIVFVDDDVVVSDSWFDSILRGFEDEDVVGVTGRLIGEKPLSGFPGMVRDFLFGGRSTFGEILDNSVINGDFYYDEEKIVDHMQGCNMAFRTKSLKDVGGFDPSYDVGNAFREETEACYKVGQEGKILYNPSASLEHLEVEESGDKIDTLFYKPYLTKYFLRKNSVISGYRNRLSYFVNKFARHLYYFSRSVAGLNADYRYYFYGEFQSFVDFVVYDREPRKYV